MLLTAVVLIMVLKIGIDKKWSQMNSKQLIKGEDHLEVTP